jgi:dTDP-4-dehydrorhamnose 3,5-epimerase
MHIKPLKLGGTFEISIEPRRDRRGYFARSYDREIFAEHGLNTDWVQENQSQSILKNTIRGLHFQHPPFTETKLVRVVQGAVLDVFVDIRKDSETFGQWDRVELTEDNLKYVYIPKGFAHGFRSLTEIATVQYKVDSVYSAEHDAGIFWNDDDLQIDWGNVRDPLVSEKDSKMPPLRDLPYLII